MASKTLEELISGLTDSLDRNSDLLEKLLSKTAAGGKTEEVEDEKPKPRGRAAAAKKEEEEDEKPKPRSRAAAAKKDETDEKPKPRGRAAAKKKVTLDDVIEQFSEYLSSGDDDAQDRAEEHVEAICDYFKVERISKLGEADFEEALLYLKQAKEDDEITFDGGTEEEEEDEKPRRRRI